MKSHAQKKKDQRKKELLEIRRQQINKGKHKCKSESVFDYPLQDTGVHRCCRVIPENQLFCEVLGQGILLVMASDQLNILGQTFRPIFTGRVVNVTNGFITLDPVIIKMSNAPFFEFPTPLSFPIESITHFTPFDSRTRISIP